MITQNPIKNSSTPKISPSLFFRGLSKLPDVHRVIKHTNKFFVLQRLQLHINIIAPGISITIPCDATDVTSSLFRFEFGIFEARVCEITNYSKILRSNLGESKTTQNTQWQIYA